MELDVSFTCLKEDVFVDTSEIGGALIYNVRENFVCRFHCSRQNNLIRVFGCPPVSNQPYPALDLSLLMYEQDTFNLSEIVGCSLSRRTTSKLKLLPLDILKRLKPMLLPCQTVKKNRRGYYYITTVGSFVIAEGNQPLFRITVKDG